MRVGLSALMIQRGRTGVAQYVRALTRALLGHTDRCEMTLFILAEDRPLFAFAEGKVRMVLVEERFRPALKNLYWHQTALVRLAKSLQLDVLHVPSYRRLLWRRPCVLVATIHDLAPFRVPGKYDPLRMVFGRTLVPHLIRRQNELIAVSHNTASDLLALLKLPRERVTVIHNGIDHDRFHPGPVTAARAAVARRHGLLEPFLLYVARLEHPGKNHGRLIEAFSRFKTSALSPWQLVLAGEDWSGAEAIRAAIRASPVSGKIRCLGFVAEEELPDLYRAAEGFVYPSLFEGFGLPPLEAMACGCPVISSTRGALGEVVEGAAWAIDPERVESIAAALHRFQEGESDRVRLRAEGLRQAAKFDWGRTAEATVAVYERAGRLKKACNSGRAEL